MITSESASPLSPDDLIQRCKLAERLICEAGALALQYFRAPETLHIENKGVQDIVTVADRAVEDLLISRIRTIFPQDCFIGEEGGVRGEAGHNQAIWVIDPIDGTANFARGLSMWCISVGLVVNSVIELGLIYHPLADELFIAKRGQGARCNGLLMQVSTVTSPQAARINLGFSFRMDPATHVAGLQKLLAQRCEYSRIGSAALGLAHVADGRFEGYWEGHVNAWDVVAGICLVTESGGQVNDFLSGNGLYQGNPLLATAPGVRDFLNENLGKLTDILAN